MKVCILAGSASSDDVLISGLRSAGVDVHVHVPCTGETPVFSLDQAGIFLKAAPVYDLIHNLSGGIGLMFAYVSGKPLITSVPEGITEDDEAVFRAASGPCFFVSEHKAAGSLGLKGVPGLGPFDGDRVRFYLDAYSLVLALGKRKEERPWGGYEILSEDRHDHKVKRITVKPGKRLSLQYHGRRREHWIIISGSALVRVGEEEVELGSAQTIDIPHRTAHRIENIGNDDLVFVEVQQGDYFGEDDIVRIEDDFGRV